MTAEFLKEFPAIVLNKNRLKIQFHKKSKVTVGPLIYAA
jgi:imidazoleglycerol phosphate synthase glutamine amidotransferase subunit HisH